MVYHLPFCCKLASVIISYIYKTEIHFPLNKYKQKPKGKKKLQHGVLEL